MSDLGHDNEQLRACDETNRLEKSVGTFFFRCTYQLCLCEYQISKGYITCYNSAPFVPFSPNLKSLANP